MILPIQITVDGDGVYDPIAGATDYNNPSLAGKVFYVTRSGYGIIPYEQYEILSTGGFRLLSGYTFQEDEVLFVQETGISYGSDGAVYSNGFNTSAVFGAMMNRLGWRNPTVTEYAIVDSQNQISRSGRYFDDFHALVRTQYLKDSIEDPTLDAAGFNAYLASLQKSVIMRCLNGVLNEKEYFEQALLYDRYGRQNVVIENTVLFVGYEIDVSKTFDKAIQIDSALLMFNEDVTFPLYLFKDGKKSAIWSEEVSAVADEATVVNFSDLILNYISSNTKGGKFFFGYFQSDLGSAKAIREDASFNCTKCFRARPFASVATGAEFNRDSYSDSGFPYGLNLEMSSFRDFTQLIVKKANLFDEVIGLTMAYTVIEQLLHNTRSNGSERILKDAVEKFGAIQELQGAAPVSDAPQVTGLNKRIERELKRVKDEFYKKPKAQTINLVC